ncbi:hypothetical protein R3W88_021106 [Solanum pinnatisectum]|uniref:Uncharacterized protein n=1 Tax=Solanum pinnatisectum TaxID=50273 RepID=A0AAV9LRL1_9SOLN|nr:hypothetical protein R3W88_021106 [Solanum pinnatisectum]
MARDSCLARVTVGVVVGGAIGGAGTYEAVSFKVSRLLKIRYIGQTTLRRATIFGLLIYWTNYFEKGNHFWSLLGCWKLDTPWKVLLSIYFASCVE